jgi:hypothetical protein
MMSDSVEIARFFDEHVILKSPILDWTKYSFHFVRVSSTDLELRFGNGTEAVLLSSLQASDCLSFAFSTTPKTNTNDSNFPAEQLSKSELVLLCARNLVTLQLESESIVQGLRRLRLGEENIEEIVC